MPELRFPGFDGEWIEYKLKDLSKIQRGASPRPINDKKWYDNENKNVGWVRIGDVTKSSRFLYETEDYFSEEGIKKSRFLPKGSLIMSICATIGKPIITGIDTCIHDGFVGFSDLNDVDKEFLYYILKNLEKRFISLSQTGSQANLNTDLINNAKVHIPSMEEQKKIVSLISTIDQKIDSMEKKLKTNNEIIKSIRNNIYSDISNPIICELSDITKIIKGKQLNKEDMDNNMPYYVLNGGKSPSGYTKEWNVQENTITISEGGESCGYVNYNKEKFYCGGHCYYLELKKEINNYYLYNYLKFREQDIMRLRVGSGLPNIQKKDLLKFKIELHENQQEKIGNLLQLLVNKSSNLTNELKFFKEYKKSLLSKMFC